MMSKFRNVIKIGEDSRIMSAKIDELNRIIKERGLKFWSQIDHKTLVELDKKYPCNFMVSQ